MIQLRNIHKSFGTLEVLKGIDLDIAQGEVVSIVGPSGAGKTTLLQIMGTLDRADSGSVVIKGTDVSRLGQKELARFRNRQIGFVFQFHQLLPEFTALENVMIPGLIGGRSRRETRQKALELLELMGLQDMKDFKASNMSYGNQRRLELARALANDPKLLLLDEPTAGMNPQEAVQMIDLVHKVHKMGMSILIIEHNMKVIMGLSERIICIEAGRKIAEGLPYDIQHNQEVIRAYLGAELD